MFVNKLTVDGQDYFLPESAAGIRDAILRAIRSGGGYVNLPTPRLPSGVDILFSPGMSVSWNRLEVEDASDQDPPQPLDSDDF